MANHGKKVSTLSSLNRSQWLKILAGVVVAVSVLVIGLVSSHLYAFQRPVQTIALSPTSVNEVSRGTERRPLNDANALPSVVTVFINNDRRVVAGTAFTDVKSVLDAGGIVLEPQDTITPALSSPVGESTIIHIHRAQTTSQTSDEEIPFNTVTQKTSSLPRGTTKVKVEGVPGVMETTSLVTTVNNAVVGKQVFTSFVKKSPVAKIVLVGTGVTSTPVTAMGTTAPIGEIQEWAHNYLLSNGYTEADFTATVFIISRESGWRVNATNPHSGAYGLPQALPGRKMASAGADWATNYQTQLRWFWNYCNHRYGSIQGAYRYWIVHHNY